MVTALSYLFHNLQVRELANFRVDHHRDDHRKLRRHGSRRQTTCRRQNYSFNKNGKTNTILSIKMLRRSLSLKLHLHGLHHLTCTAKQRYFTKILGGHSLKVNAGVIRFIMM